MTDSDSSASSLTPVPSARPSLRQQAEEKYQSTQAQRAPDPSTLSPQAVHLMLHELSVHQIELEMQNEELRQSQTQLATEQARYFDLYDLAPVGYLSLDMDGLIQQANLTAATLLKAARGALIRQPMARFIASEDQDDYYLLQKKLVNTQVLQSCELRLKRGDDTPFWVHLAASASADDNGGATLRVVLTDINERKRAEQQLLEGQTLLRESAQQNQIILDNMLDGVITLNAQGLIQTFNLAASQIFGYHAQEMLGHNVNLLMPEPHRSQHDGYLQHHQRAGTTRIIGQTREVEGLRQDGTLVHLTLSVSKATHQGQPVFIGLVRDNTQQHHAIEEIRRLAFFDPLTGLPNRRLLLDRISQAMVTSGRTGMHAALMFLDLDHFKRLNDSLGHDYGDLLLQMVSTRLQACVREGDTVARIGGDEFVLLLEGLSNYTPEAAAQAETLANKIIQVMGQPYSLHGLTHTSTPSIGIAVFMADQETVEELIKKSDAAMYQAKAGGRNTFRFFDPEMQAAAADHAELETDLRTGLAKHQFLLLYQIQVNQLGAPIGAEALVRWQHPTRGRVSPAHFIALAEESGLILPLGQWVLDTACTQLRAWADQLATAHWTMAVNVSALQFAQPDFVDTVTQTVQRSGVNPSLLKLELTESMLVGNVPETIVKMGALQALGVRFSLDDFGTGYSSLSYLKRLPLDQLKIDQSFVIDLQIDSNDAVIARAIVALGHSLDMKVIAEGVETVEQRDFLAAYGCDAFQGYYFGRPVPASELGVFISQNKL